MVNATFLFWLLVGMFGLIGSMRLWQREIVSTAGIILGIFAMSYFIRWLLPTGQQASEAGARFILLMILFGLIVIAGYSSPMWARPQRFPLLERVGATDGIAGFLLGCVNGYLLLSSVFHFAKLGGLLPSATAGGSDKTLPSIIAPQAGWDALFFVANAAPVVLTGPVLIVAMVVTLLFVFIVLI
jgi:hypothetical protein